MNELTETIDVAIKKYLDRSRQYYLDLSERFDLSVERTDALKERAHENEIIAMRDANRISKLERLAASIITQGHKIDKLEQDSHWSFCDVERVERRLAVLESSEPSEITFTLTLPLSSKNTLEVAIDHAIEHHDDLIDDELHCPDSVKVFEARRRDLRLIKSQLLDPVD